MKRLFFGFLGGSAVMPIAAFAQDFGNTIQLVSSATYIVDLLIYIVASLALLTFFWGIVKYISAAGDAAAAQKGKSIMIYGVVALFVMFSIWGIIRFIRYDLGVSNSAPIPPPRLGE